MSTLRESTMDLEDMLSSNDTRLLVDRLTLSLFILTGVLVAFAEWSVLPREALIAGIPAIVVSMLIDTFLFNEFLIRTGAGLWVIVYACIYVQSIVIAALVRTLGRYRPGNREQTVL